MGSIPTTGVGSGAVTALVRSVLDREDCVLDDIEKRLAVERQAALLLGQRVVSIRYFGLDIGGGLGWERVSDGLDTMDFGLDLDLDDGRTVGITWGWEFGCYGLSIQGHTLAKDLNMSGVGVWDLTAYRQWTRLIDAPIVSASVHWDVIFDNDKALVPLSLAITFETDAGPRDTVYVCAAHYVAEMDELFVGGDDVTILFGDDSALRYDPRLFTG